MIMFSIRDIFHHHPLSKGSLAAASRRKVHLRKASCGEGRGVAWK